MRTQQIGYSLIREMGISTKRQEKVDDIVLVDQMVQRLLMWIMMVC